MAEKLPDFISTHWQKVNQVSATLPEMPHKLQLLLRDSRWLTGWLTDNDRLIDWLNKTHFSIPDRGLMARTVFWVLCSSSTSSLSSSSSPQRLQPTAEQMYRSWDERNERGGDYKEGYSTVLMWWGRVCVGLFQKTSAMMTLTHSLSKTQER